MCLRCDKNLPGDGEVFVSDVQREHPEWTCAQEHAELFATIPSAGAFETACPSAVSMQPHLRLHTLELDNNMIEETVDGEKPPALLCALSQDEFPADFGQLSNIRWCSQAQSLDS